MLVIPPFVVNCTFSMDLFLSYELLFKFEGGLGD